VTCGNRPSACVRALQPRWAKEASTGIGHPARPRRTASSRLVLSVCLSLVLSLTVSSSVSLSGCIPSLSRSFLRLASIGPHPRLTQHRHAALQLGDSIHLFFLLCRLSHFLLCFVPLHTQSSPSFILPSPFLLGAFTLPYLPFSLTYAALHRLDLYGHGYSKGRVGRSLD